LFSLSFTGGYRVLPYLDPSEERHTKLKTFCFNILKDNGPRLFSEFRY
jgi:hydroperoxide dehydratase